MVRMVRMVRSLADRTFQLCLVLRILLGFLHIFLDLRHHVLDEAEAPGARGLCWL